MASSRPRPPGLTGSPPSSARKGIEWDVIGATVSGNSIDRYKLSNARGSSLQVLTYGGIIAALTVPDRHGVLGDVVLGFDTLEGYLDDTSYMGALIGRYANRIAGARFVIDGDPFELSQNEGRNHLHGGVTAFHNVVWEANPVQSDRGVALALRYTSPAGSEGYPGMLSVHVTYTLTDKNVLICDYHATSDAATPVSLTQHSYFNLAGIGNICDHQVQIHAERFLPVDKTLIPTGEMRSVHGTPFDFTTPVRIGERIGANDEQLHRGAGYDHYYVIRNPEGSEAIAKHAVPAVAVYEPTTGRRMSIQTTEPGLQFYTGNQLNGRIGKGGVVYDRRVGFCIETQNFPDAPNQPSFPSAIVRPERPYRSQTSFAFTF